MPTNVQEFEDETAYERYVLERGTPFLPKAEGGIVIELGDGGSVGATVQVPPARVRVSVTDSFGSAEGAISFEAISALIFGAAWKVLDLLVEWRLVQLGIHESKRKPLRYMIEFKTKAIGKGDLKPMTPFNAQPDLWERIADTYAATANLRRSLVHRRIHVDPSTRAMTATQEPGEPAPIPLTIDEQLALCRLADGAAKAVIAGDLSIRQVDSLRWLSDQLTAHHGRSAFGVSAIQGKIPEIVIRPSVGPANELDLDFTGLRHRAHAAVGGMSYYNLQIHLPDGQILTGALEDAPPGRVQLSVTQPPAWLRWM